MPQQIPFKHSSLTSDNEIHFPKGFSTAELNTTPVKTGSNTIEWRLSSQPIKTEINFDIVGATDNIIVGATDNTIDLITLSLTQNKIHTFNILVKIENSASNLFVQLNFDGFLYYNSGYNLCDEYGIKLYCNTESKDKLYDINLGFDASTLQLNFKSTTPFTDCIITSYINIIS